MVLAFLAGWTQREPRRAALLGAACTLSALIGYGVMTLSPVENAHPSVAAVAAFIRSESEVLVGGVVTGPLGQQDSRRPDGMARGDARSGSKQSAAAVASAEVAVGIAMMTHVATRMLLRPAAVE